MNTNPQNAVVIARNLRKSFATPSGELVVLTDVSFTIQRGERVAIVGPSGSGKSTLLSLLGLLDSPTVGEVIIAGVSTTTLSETAQAAFRNEHIGFIFQNFELISAFTAAENVAASLEIGGAQHVAERTDSLLNDLGISDRKAALPKTLSGGEKQRVAIGRALAPRPELILADEPTGSLDRATGERVIEMLVAAVEKNGSTLIVITHDETVAARMDRVFELRDKTLHERS